MAFTGFINWLFSEEKKPYYEDSNGLIAEGDKDTLLKPDGQPAHLDYAPDGWKDTLVNYGRNETYLGLFREFTVPMRFVKDGAKILRHILWTKGKNAIAYFAMHRLNRLTYPTLYDTFTYGELDFVKSKQQQKDNSFTINVMQGGLSKLLKSNEGTIYEIRINTDLEHKELYLDGLPFNNKVIYTIYNGQEIVGSDPGVALHYLGMGVIDKTGISQGVIIQDQIYQLVVPLPNNNFFTGSVNKTILVKLKGKVNGMCTAGSNGTIGCSLRRVSDSSSTVYEEIGHIAPGDYDAGQEFSIDIDTQITLYPNQRLTFIVGASNPVTSTFQIWGTEISVEYEVSFDPTICKCLTPYTLFKRLVDKMTEGKYGVKSDFLSNLDDIFITSGTALRVYFDDSSVKTSLSDFFQALRTLGKKKYSVGLGIENDKLVIEELDYFFRQDIIMDLGIVNDLEVSVAENMIYNTIKVGYKDQTVDDINGRNEVNVTQLYSTPNTRSPKELNLVSPYRADPYGIEATRTDQFGQKQTSNKSDNETFITSVEKQASISIVYYSGGFQIEINTGFYYVKIPTVLNSLTPGEQIVITNSVSNNGTFTVEATIYIIAGFTYIKVTQPVTNEIVLNGNINFISTTIWNLKRPAYTSITGVANPSRIYNVELSPKRGLLNCGGLIHSTHDKDDIKLIKFESAIRNIELSTTIGGVTIAEKDSVLIGSLQEKLFLEYYMSFTTQVPIDFTTLMTANPYGKIQFTDGKTGIVLYGFLWDGGIKPEPTEKQTWKIIAAPNQDLSRFIS